MTGCQRRARTTLASLCLVWAALPLVQCGGSGHGAIQSPVAAADGGGQADEDAGHTDPCVGQPNGTRCLGERHCIDARCVWNTCGDGIKAGDEACDDGNQSSGDGCSASCQVEKVGCGNGIREGDEECDDGNDIDQDACSNHCTKNECGNMRVDVGEECDDGNTVDDDKCSNHCKEVRCRNGRVDPGEECDDGNAIDNDGCTNMCKIQSCGNGKVEGKEECDDGNQQDADACSNHCTRNSCGNMRVDPGEECDGSLDCTPQCKKKSAADDTCTPCERAQCVNFMDMDVDLVRGCLDDNPDPNIVMQKYAPGEFAGDCMSVLNCARTNQCVIATTIADSCYCGSSTPDQCVMMPPADAKCVDVIEKALATTSSVTVSERLANPTYPGGNAYLLLECDVMNCKKECVPWLP